MADDIIIKFSADDKNLVKTLKEDFTTNNKTTNQVKSFLLEEEKLFKTTLL